jgi:PKHD-type hydroxylase
MENDILRPQLLFVPKSSQMTEYYWFQEGFSKSEIDIILENVQSLPFQEARVAADRKGDDLHEMRKSEIKWIPQNPHFKWIYDRLAKLIIEANEALWQFDLTGILDNIQFTVYHDGGGHYDWHLDIGPRELSWRKISLTIQMSEDEDYEGGELEFMLSKNPIKAPRGKGVVVVFPSYLLHRVTPVSKGTRKSMVLWVGGGRYK